MNIYTSSTSCGEHRNEKLMPDENNTLKAVGNDFINDNDSNDAVERQRGMDMRMFSTIDTRTI